MMPVVIQAFRVCAVSRVPRHPIISFRKTKLNVSLNFEPQSIFVVPAARLPIQHFQCSKENILLTI